MFQSKIRKNISGQMAIFFALIFQVLFLLFAMVVNVGLLVHHKVNLQNSVDLAAYYGAMKQAEMMNAIGHVNYQMHQSWKLLVWRYRIYGQGGQSEANPPYNYRTKLIENSADEIDIDSMPAQDREYYLAPNFCIAYVPFKPMPGGVNSGDTSCKNTLLKGQSKLTLNLFTPPPVIAGFYNLSSLTRNAAIATLGRISNRCKFLGEFNWTMLARFVVGYSLDQADRKQTINFLARGLSKAEDDFIELNGTSAKDGIKATLLKNLSIPNRESLNEAKFKVMNGLGSDKCGAGSTGQYDPPKWLSEVKVVPAFFTLDNECAGVSEGQPLKTVPKLLTAATLPNYRDTFKDEIETLKEYVDPLGAPYNASLGFEKNPWCMSYVGVSAVTKPKIPFSPLGEVEIKAVAFAKPFGSRIGPWYNTNWDPSSPNSNRGPKVDEVAPPRVLDLANVAEPRDPTRVPNYSRYPGDKLGLMSRNTLGRYHRLLYSIGPPHATQNTYLKDKSPSIVAVPNDESPNFNYWNKISQPYPGNLALDYLAWDDIGDIPPVIREMEISAIAPDLFDITYYPIESDFYNNYYTKLTKEYLSKNSGFQFKIRPDLGGRIGSGQILEKFSVKDQVDTLKRWGPALDFEGTANGQQGLSYVVQDAVHLLTSWVGTDLQNYNLNPEFFGKCKTAPKEGIPNPGNCVVGGRTGSSVKLVSMDYLYSQDLEIGGEGGTPGPLLNPPNLE